MNPLNTIDGPSTSSDLMNRCFDHAELLRRGWFDSVIAALLPDCDLLAPNAQDLLLLPERHYLYERVIQIEKEPPFSQLTNEILQMATKNLLDIGSNYWKLFQIAHQIPLDCAYPAIKELEALVTQEVPIRFAGKKVSELPIEDLQILAVQILMRHFQPELCKLEPYFFNSGYQRAREIVMDRLLHSIWDNYPGFENACHAVALQNDFMLFSPKFYESE